MFELYEQQSTFQISFVTIRFFGSPKSQKWYENLEKKKIDDGFVSILLKS